MSHTDVDNGITLIWTVLLSCMQY